MAISGPKALRSLDNAVRDIRREESQITKRLSRSTERAAKVRESEAELFRKLAATRLNLSEQEQIDQRLSKAEKAAKDVLKAHASQIAKSEKQLEEFDKQIASIAKVRQQTLEAMEEDQSKLKILADNISSAIEKDPDYATKRARSNELRIIAEEAIKKTEQAEQDQEQKGRPYRQDPLFMYLWDAGYGTKNYKANNLVRWLDNFVAKLVDYQEARPNFSMLNEIPLRLREHAQRQAQAAEIVDEELDLLETQAIEKAGGGPITSALEQARERLDQLDAQMLELEDDRDEMARAFSELAEGKDPVFSNAVDDLAGALQGRDIDELMAAARKTATGRDDGIVAKISDARARAFDHGKEIRELRTRLKVLEQRRRELEDIGWEFKKSRFDDPRSQFRQDDLVGDLLGEFLRGAITAANYWGQWQRSQSWKAGTGDWGGSFGLPRGGRRSNSSRRSSHGSSSRKSSSRNNSSSRGPWNPGGSSKDSSSRPRSPWANPSGRNRSSAKNFSRPRRSGSKGSRRSSSFKTGGGF